MTESSVLIVGVVVAFLAIAGLVVWGALAIAARARRQKQHAQTVPDGASRSGGPAFGDGPAFTRIPDGEVPARIPFGGSLGSPAAETATPPAVPAEIVAADVPFVPAALSYTPAMLRTEAPGSGSLPSAPIEMPSELSVQVGPAAPTQQAARPLIDSVPDFSAPPAAAAPPAVLSVREQPAGTGTAASEIEAADDMDATIIAGRRNRAWVFESESGQRVPLSAEVVLLGRNPSPIDGFEDAQLVTVRDLGRTVSKTHARVHRHEGGWLITDLSSTNGVYLIGSDGNEIELQPGIPTATTDQFILGDMSARIFQEE